MNKRILANAKTDRRTFLAAATGMLFAPAILGSSRARAAGKIVYACGGGSYVDAVRAAFLDPFTKETDIEVVTVGNTDLAKLKSQIMTGSVDVDLTDVIGTEVGAASAAGLLEPIDYSLVKTDKSDLIYPDAVRKDSLGLFTYTSGIGSSAASKASGKYPSNWKEFWDVSNFPGRRGLRSRPNETLEIALLAQGVTPDKLYPLDVKRAFESLDAIKPNIRKWIDTTPQTVELLSSGELDFVNTFNGRVFAANKAGVDLGYSSEQLLIELGVVAVPKGAKNPKQAMELMNFILRPDRQAQFCEMLAYPPISRKAIELISPDLKKWIPKDGDTSNLVVNTDWWGEPGRLADINNQFQTWLLS